MTIAGNHEGNQEGKTTNFELYGMHISDKSLTRQTVLNNLRL